MVPSILNFVPRTSWSLDVAVVVKLALVPMSVTRPLGIESVYFRVIEDTIAESANLQSPAVLDQLKQRWVERLQEKLLRPNYTSLRAPALSPENTTVPTSQKSQAATSIQPLITSFPGHAPVITTASTPVSGQLSSRLPTIPTGPITFSIGAKSANSTHQVSQIEQSIKSPNKETFGLKQDEEDEDWDTTEWKVADGDSAGIHPDKAQQDENDITKAPELSSHPKTAVNLLKIEASTTAVDSSSLIEKPSTHDMSETSKTGRMTTSQSQSMPTTSTTRLSDSASSTEVTVFGSQLSRNSTTMKNQASTVASRQPHRQRGVIVETETDLYDDEENINEEDLSDLEDTEPDCSDLVVSQFESVQRPHARKAIHKGLWRIKLRHGILQIDGKEILFNTMAGDLSF